MSSKFQLLIVVATFVTVFGSSSSLNPHQEQEILRNLPPSGYDPRVRPVLPRPDDPTPVQVRVHVLDVEGVDDKRSELTIQANIHLSWKDARLAFTAPGRRNDSITLTENLDKFWNPEVQIRARNIQTQKLAGAEALEIWSSGDVTLVRYGVRLTLCCARDLANYPFDVVQCPLIFQCNTHPDEEIALEWNQESVEFPSVQVSNPEEIPLFTLEDDFGELDDDRFNLIQATFKLRRDSGPVIRNVYVPTAMIVIFSWTSFWMEPEALSARVLIGMGSLFILANQVTAYQSSLPVTSDPKAVDVWTGICLTFVFLAFLEFMTVNYLPKVSKYDAKDEPEGGEETTLQIESKPEPSLERLLRKHMPRIKEGARNGDKMARVVFPAAFLLFVGIYFAVYC